MALNSDAITKFVTSHSSLSECFHRPGLLDFLPAFFACPPRVVVPEIEHRLTEMFNDIRAVEMNVFHQCPAIFAVENDVLFFSWRAATLHHHAQCIRRPLG